MENEKDPCPVNCPNRGNVLELDFGTFKVHLDFIELLLWGIILAIPVQTSIRDAFRGGLSFEEVKFRMAEIVGYIVAVRSLPTDKFSKWMQSITLFKVKK